ncbi:hypothetical protein SDC9_187089 [bioreactor metagenome]|uniref:Uncharacterized protein n=1 Tax=bioreactor metagenome TaxID=1076179 RepID=A0A645HKM9_9ZZZZ
MLYAYVILVVDHNISLWIQHLGYFKVEVAEIDLARFWEQTAVPPVYVGAGIESENVFIPFNRFGHIINIDADMIRSKAKVCHFTHRLILLS